MPSFLLYKFLVCFTPILNIVLFDQNYLTKKKQMPYILYLQYNNI